MKIIIKRSLDVLCIFLIIICISGCELSVCDESDEEVIYNGFSSQWIQDGRNYVSLYGPEESLLYEKKTGEYYDFNRNPFGNNEYYQIIYPDKNGFYFIEILNSGYALKYYDECFDERQLFEVKYGYSVKNQLLGEKERDAMDYVSSAEIQDKEPVQFVVDGGKMYYLSYGGIWEHDLKKGNAEKIITVNYASPYLSYMDHNLYYLDMDYILRSYNTDTRDIIEFSDIITEQFVVSEYGIVFNNLADDKQVYYYDFHSKTACNLGIGNVDSYDLEQDILYYAVSEELYQIRLGSKKAVFLKKLDSPVHSLKKISNEDLVGYLKTDPNNEMEVVIDSINP